jgi:small subunit ribosomal protein S17
MSDDENKETTDETSDETQQDADTQTAGPVADEGSSSSRDDAAGEDPSSAPPAGEDAEDSASDAPAADAEGVAEAEADDAPEAEQEEDAPAAEQAEDAAAEEAPGERNPEDELPWKERLRLQRSRKPHKAGPALDVEGRKAQRAKEREAKAKLRRKQRAAAKAAHVAGTGTPAAERDSNAAKVRQGIVVSNKGDKSITVRIDIARRHPTYEKIVRRSRTLHAHDERNEAGEGDVVQVIETRPLSKTKRWRLVEILERAK